MKVNLVGATVLAAVVLALTGCSPAAVGAAPSTPPSVSGMPTTAATAPASPPAVSGAPASAVTTDPATVGGSAPDASTLGDISKDLDSVDGANAQADTDQRSADAAATTSDG